MTVDNWDYLGQHTHALFSGKARCPKCGSEYPNVTEQGYDHNHRHHCNKENVTYWIYQD